MNPKTRNLIIGIILMCTVGLIGTLVGCSGVVPSPGPTEPPAPTLTPRPLPTPAGTPTRADEIAQEFVAKYGLVTTVIDCQSTGDPGNECYVFEASEQITRPEWDELLTRTRFYVVNYTDYVGDPPDKLSQLFVEQDSQRYTTQTYNLLLEANDIAVTDTNRELIAKAWALMTIPGYLGEEVTFTKWEEVSYTAEQAGYAYNYNLQGWTELGGWEVGWWFVFGGDRLEVASGPSVGESGIGDYIEQYYYPTRFYDAFHDWIFLEK